MSAPGWHTDPAGTGRQRYYDGNGWTDQYADQSQPPVASVPPKKKRRGLLIGVGAVVVIIVIAALAGGGKDSEPAASPPSSETSRPAAPSAPSSTSADGGKQITYEVQSDGALLSVNYYDAMNNMTTLQDQPATWSTSFDGEATIQLYSMSAQTQGEQVSCKITVNGEVIASESATGRYALVTCAAA